MNHIVRQILREPLLHFTVLGVLLLVVSRWLESLPGDSAGPGSGHFRIVITPEQVQRLDQGWLRQNGTAPTSGRSRSLVDQYVREEILYREGLRLGLDRDDEIIRRRIVQKVEFLQQDLEPVAAPTSRELETYYREHQQKYALPERRSFSHIYFSPDRDGEAAARQRALDVLKELPSTSVSRDPDRGDRFAGLYDYSSLTAAGVSRVFGESELSRAVFSTGAGQWSGPYRSGLGWHLVYVREIVPARTPQVQEILDTVRADFTEEMRERRNAAAFARLRDKYTVVREHESQAPMG
jgi:peptidyl-prolyl cis-trans isomerase C